MTARNVRIAVYGDVDLNIIDGSAIWLQSVATVFVQLRRSEVTVVLKAPIRRDLLTRPLGDLPNVTVVNPIEEGAVKANRLTPDQALNVLAEIDRQRRFDAVVLRGFNLCHRAAHESTFAGRLWPYLTDIPQHASAFTDDSLQRLHAIADSARYLLCQTEALRTHLEAYVPAVAGRAILLPPMIPDDFSPLRETPTTDPLKLVYVGKHAPRWNTYEMTQLVAELRAEGVAVELHVVGDKIHKDPKDTGFHDRMKVALTDTDGVIWHGAKSRAETRDLLARFDVALGWRDADLDDSLELSTKLLEYGAAGIPAIINRTPMHEELFGADYPLFANSPTQFKRAVTAAVDASTRRDAASRCATTARAHTFKAVATHLQRYVDRAIPPRKSHRAVRILVAGHDLKFFGRIQEHLTALPGVECRVDSWSALDRHDVAASERALAWADVIICEWCVGNAVWYSENKRRNQKLIVRLHRAELYNRFCAQVRFDNVDQVVFVGDHYRDQAMAQLDWNPSKLVVIPNFVDTALLDRPKLAGAIFNLGMIGIAPMRKRLDRGVNVLERLREVDDRFQLFAKSKMPWEYSWVWKDLEERAHYGALFERLNSAPLLRGAVHFDPFGPEVPAWLRKVGFVLSTSDDESFHLSPAEGMASRALPMLLDWDGVDKIYPDEWIHADEDAIVDHILTIVDERSWVTYGEDVRTYIDRNYSVERVCRMWEELAVGRCLR